MCRVAFSAEISEKPKKQFSLNRFELRVFDVDDCGHRFDLAVLLKWIIFHYLQHLWGTLKNSCSKRSFAISAALNTAIRGANAAQSHGDCWTAAKSACDASSRAAALHGARPHVAGIHEQHRDWPAVSFFVHGV